MRFSIRRHRLIRTVVGGLGIVGMAAAATATPAAATATTVKTLPVYTVQQVGLTDEQAAELQRAFGLERLERGADGSVRFVDEAAFQHVPTVLGERGQGEDGPTLSESLDFDALAKITVVPADDATAITNRALRSAGLLPDGAKAMSDHTMLETASLRGALTSTKLDTATSYSFALDGMPYEGPGAKIRVSYDGTGKVSQLRYATRTLLKRDSVPVANVEAGARRCAATFPAGAKVDAAYSYYAPPLASRPSILEPSFRCTGTTADGAALQVTFVPAVQDVKPGGPSSSGKGKARTATTPGSRSAGITVGSEGTGPCSGLANTGQNLNSFNTGFNAHGVPVDFSWLNGDAWEDDFKDPAFGGNDTTWTDNVDMAYWQGHGSPNGFSFSGCSSIDDTFMHRNDARWGNNDVEWMSLFTCLVLAGTDGGLAWWQRWGGAFHRLHQINSFDTVSYHSSKHGGIYADYLMGWNLKVRTAWALTSIDDQPAEVNWASMGPIGPGGMVNINDHFHGQGTVGPDVSASALTGWWYLRGAS